MTEIYEIIWMKCSYEKGLLACKELDENIAFILMSVAMLSIG